MKKVLLMLVVMLGVFESTYAFKIGGFEISIQRGKPEWNADHTDTKCVGGGICIGRIAFDVDIPSIKTIPDGQEGFNIEGNMYSANVVKYNNKLAIEFSLRFYNNFRSDFIGDKFSINRDINLTSQALNLIGLSGSTTIKAGTYPFIKDKSTGALLVIIR